MPEPAITPDHRFRGSLMIQGTTSDAGKSTLVAGLCRWLARRGASVAPFKPQNMALNSAVTEDGGEIGRAQALQARAAGLAPHSDMNPVLIKPASDTGAQIIIQGQVNSAMTAQSFHQFKPAAMACVQESYSRLQASYDAILVEGAGSPAEINLREGDIANMGFAEAVDCPVVLIADINPGGVFAHIVGTLELLSPSERARIRGFVINRFRGDISLLQPGLDWLEERTGKPVFGVLPWLHNLHLEAEDAIDTRQQPCDANPFRVAVPVLPRISNHTDFDALRRHPGVQLDFLALDETPAADLIILPGSKNVRADLAALRDHGWQQKLHRHLRYGGKLLGICGGYQMLGHSIADPLGLEDAPGTSEGFGLLDANTQLQPQKHLANVSGELCLGGARAAFQGYEIHMGESTVSSTIAPLQFSDGRSDGALSSDNAILGCYVHGLFDRAGACNQLLHWAGLESTDAVDTGEALDRELDRLADALDQHLDMAALLAELSC